MALYKILKVKDKELKLRLRSRDCVELEQKLGRSPLDVLMECSKGKVPTIGFIIAVLQCGLKAYEHGYTQEKVFDLYDEYIEDGGELSEMIEIITDLFEVSGFFKEPEKKASEISEQKPLEMLQEKTQEKIIV